jgi:MerR family Zn(II)-responsive transcriptional regulator of zntA
MESKTMLKIDEHAALASVSRDTLRFYEKQGLIRPGERTDASYRLYTETDEHRISLIMSAKEVGFTRNEIHQLLKLEVTKDEKSCHDIKQFVDAKISIVNQRLAEIKRVKKSLQTLSNAC